MIIYIETNINKSRLLSSLLICEIRSLDEDGNLLGGKYISSFTVWGFG